MPSSRRIGRPVIALLIAIALYRLSLLDRGVLGFVDETRYFTSVLFLESLASGNDGPFSARHARTLAVDP